MALIFSVLSYFYLQVVPIEREEFDTRVPITGQQITITGAEFQWREVNSQDKVAEGTLFIPEIKLTFSPESKGSIVCFFENNQEQTVGDGFSFDITAGQFTTMDNALQLTSSSGYKEKSNYVGYTYSSAPFWSLVIKEVPLSGPSTTLTKIPLKPN